jgi:hypothetical protein
MPHCSVVVMDRDEGMLRSDDFLGEAVIPWDLLYPQAGKTHMANTATIKLSGKKAKGHLTVSCAVANTAVGGGGMRGTLAAAGKQAFQQAMTTASTASTTPPGMPPPGLGPTIKAKASAVLGPGQGVKIADAFDNVPDVFTMGKGKLPSKRSANPLKWQYL